MAQEEEEPDEEEEEQIAGEAEREEILISNVVECVGTLMKAHHSAYLPVFEEQMAQIIMAMMQPSAADYGIGVLAEFGKAFLGEAEQQQCAQAMLQVVEHAEAWSEDNATASDNAVSALGKLCKLSDNT